MARFYSDEDFPLRVVLRLRAMNHDLLNIQETGLANRSTPACKRLEKQRAEHSE